MLFAALPEWVTDVAALAFLTGSLVGTWIALGRKFEDSVGNIVQSRVGQIVEEKLDDKMQHLIDQFRAEIHLTEERFTVQIKQMETKQQQTDVEILDLRARVVALENANSKKEKK